MSKTVYVEVTSNYSRSTWDDLGSTNYNPGDRVDHFDGSRNRIFVCINSNNSTTEPQNNPTDWAPAGSEQYPFLLVDSSANLNSVNNSEWTIHGTSSSTVNFLVEELGTWTPDNPIGGNATYQGDGQDGTIILGDGRYTFNISSYAMWWPNNCTIQAKNRLKAYIIVNCSFWGGNNVTWKDVVLFNESNSNVLPGSYSFGGSGFKHNLESCLSTQETPWGTLTPTKQDPSSTLWIRAIANAWAGGYIKNCTFDYQYKGPSYLFNLSAGSGAVFENNTFYIRVKNSQYNLIYNGGDIRFKNNIFYIKYLQDGHQTEGLVRLSTATEGTNVLYLENDSDTGGTINNNLSGGITINPLFVDADKSNFALRPSSPLIGGFSETSSRYRLYVTAAEKAGPVSFDTPSDNASFYTFSSYIGNKFLVGMRTSYNGEIYECILDHDYDSTQDPSSDSTNWRLVEGTIDDPYKSCDFNDTEGAINNKLTNNHDLILLDGDYSYFPITSDSSYPTTSPILRPLNKHKAIIYQSSFRPAGFIAKDLIFQNNSLAKSGFNAYPLDGRVGFHLEGCVVHSSGTWWPPLNCVVKGSLIFSELNNNQGMFYASFGQASSPAPTDKAITFVGNTVIFTGSLDNTSDSVLTSLINQGNMNATFQRNIFYLKSEFNAGPATKWTLSVFSNASLVFEDNVAFDESGVIVDDLRGMEYIDPKLIDTNSSDILSYRLRPESPVIGGSLNKNFAEDSVWVQQGTGTGTGTEDDPFYWSQYSDAFLAATQTTSKQVVFKDGEYLWINSIIQDDNVGNAITMVAENIHQALFYDNGRISSSGKNPTLRFKGIQLEARDHFTWQQECHYVLDHCHFIISKYMASLSIIAKGCIFEVATGANMTIFSNTGPIEIQNCVFADHNDRQPSDTYLTSGTSGTFKNCIFYCKYPRTTCLSNTNNKSLVNCASQNITNPEAGVEFSGNIQFVDIDGKNYNLRPTSPLIGQGA